MNPVYNVAEWIIYNIEDLSYQYIESGSSLSFFSYIKNRTSVALKDKYTPEEIQNIFKDGRIKIIIKFYEEDIDESEDSLH